MPAEGRAESGGQHSPRSVTLSAGAVAVVFLALFMPASTLEGVLLRAV